MEKMFKNSEITIIHFNDTDKYFISKTDLKRSLECGAAIKVVQTQLELDIYGMKSKPLDIYYEVFSFRYPENMNLKICEAQKPIILYQLMEDIDCYISIIDYGKSVENGARITIDEENKYCAPMIDQNLELYKVDNYYFSSDIDVRFKKISKYYIEKTCKRI